MAATQIVSGVPSSRSNTRLDGRTAQNSVAHHASLSGGATSLDAPTNLSHPLLNPSKKLISVVVGSKQSQITPRKQLQLAPAPPKMSVGFGTQKTASGPPVGQPNEEKLDARSQPGQRRRKRSNHLRPGQSAGRWTPHEHQAFLEGLKIHGREWKKVADHIPTRTSAQIRSHAQKYFAKLAHEQKMATESMMIDPSLLRNPALTSQPQQGSFGQPTGLGTPSAHLTPSVRRNVERILSDPRSAQQEVESTLAQLRERYNQLQIRLQEQNRRNGLNQRPENLNGNGNDRPPSMRNPHVDRQKRSLEEAMRQVSHPREQNDNESTNSSVTTSIANASKEELIALDVLGGTLPRNASNESLPVQTEENNVPDSPTSSLTIPAITDQGNEGGSTTKKRRLSEEEENN